jgi:hypothetical protein
MPLKDGKREHILSLTTCLEAVRLRVRDSNIIFTIPNIIKLEQFLTFQQQNK